MNNLDHCLKDIIMSTRVFRSISTRLPAWGTLLALAALYGCGSDAPDPVKSTSKAAVESSAIPAESTPGIGNNAVSGNTAQSSQPSQPAAPNLDQQIAAVQSEIESGNLEGADEKLAALRNSLGESLSEDQLAKLRPVEKALSDRREAVRREERGRLLEAAKAAFDTGKWDESLKQIDAVAALAPGESERETLNGLRTSIDQAMKARLRLASWIRMLGSANSGEVKTAQTQLLEEPEAALPLVREAVRGNDPVTTRNSLEFLRKLRKPEITLPIMVSVLEDPGQEASWEVAAKEIVRLEQAGAGPKLLQLVLTSSLPQQRQVAASALASIVDPPETTALSLLPVLFRDSSELATTLSACTHAILVHHHHDLLEWRAVSETISETQSQQLSQLGDRLKALQSLPADQQKTIEAARHLAIALRLVNPEPIPGVQILDATPTDASVKPTALLDGVWNTIDPTTMWWTPVNANGYVVLDLGASRTVTGVRIWNFNESGAGYRGWKDVEVYVSDTQTALRPVAQGLMLPAPGIADPQDYSQVIPVNFAQGRYVKLACKEYLAQSSHAGLTEIQILGY
jgi:hypothetical protein